MNSRSNSRSAASQGGRGRAQSEQESGQAPPRGRSSSGDVGAKSTSTSRSRSRSRSRAGAAGRRRSNGKQQHGDVDADAVVPANANANATAASDRYSIIAPTYNEAENVPLVAALVDRACASAGLDYELIFVDDASPDGTADVVRELQRCFPPGRVLLVTRRAKLGLGSAYAAGLERATGGWVVLMDADLSHHPRHLPELVALQRATGADVVGGSRYLAGGGVAGWGAGRKLTSRGANVLARTLLGLGPVTDLTGAFRLYRRALLARLLGRCRCTGYAFQMEMAARAVASGARFAEAPIVFVDRVYGSSKLGPHEFAQFLSGLARLLVEL